MITAIYVCEKLKRILVTISFLFILTTIKSESKSLMKIQLDFLEKLSEKCFNRNVPRTEKLSPEFGVRELRQNSFTTLNGLLNLNQFIPSLTDENLVPQQVLGKFPSENSIPPEYVIGIPTVLRNETGSKYLLATSLRAVLSCTRFVVVTCLCRTKAYWVDAVYR